MNKKKLASGIIIVVFISIGIGIFLLLNNNNSSTEENSYEADRTATTDQSDESYNEDHSNINEVKQGITESQNSEPPLTEEQIATFSTKIYSTDSARQNNITITCNTLNGTIVKNNETFSFCGTVGEASTSKGYQKADIFDKNGNKKKGLGGRKLSN